MDTDVVIVGGGPSGLTLGLALARHEIKSIILEKDREITQDPRGVVLTGDALRNLWTIGLGKHVSNIGQELASLNFHTTTHQNETFYRRMLDWDMLEHALPTTILQSQPRVEYYLRQLVASSEYCSLLPGCEVVGRDEHPHGVTVHYLDSDKTRRQIQAGWLVGADGKRGVVRKHFLEPTAGIRQETGIFKYEGTWIAANLKIALPTKESHPDSPLWAAGVDPEAVYDLFWPPNWHFCRPPGRPVACGRFGPHADRLWRHEFAVPDWNDSMDAHTVFWEELTPFVTRKIQPVHGGPPVEVTFPRDCIEVLRCRPFRFSHRVVNKWFAERTMLIGDAAHVFPPFGGQGVACGVQDAIGLSWRLAILTKVGSLARSPAIREALLQGWADERRMGTDMSAKLTRQNGELCNKAASWSLWLQLTLLKTVEAAYAALGMRLNLLETDSGYGGCARGAFLAKHGGGPKLGQIYVQTRLPDSPTVRVELSDKTLRRVPTIFTLLVVAPAQSPETEREVDGLLQLLRKTGIDPDVLSERSIVQFDPSHSSELLSGETEWPVCRSASMDLLVGFPVRPGYDPTQFMRRLDDPRARYVVLRPDNIVYGRSRDLGGLKSILDELEGSLSYV